MITCTKRYRDIPFAHRQHNHDGHCAWIHGHNWGIEIEFEAKKLDRNGFVIDFGRLKFLKEWMDNNLDHCLLVNADDPLRAYIEDKLADRELAKIRIVPDGSAEGLAQYFHRVFNGMVLEESLGRVWVKRVTVYEDEKNSATFQPGV